MILPGAIIIVNDDLTDTVQSTLETQLFITETISGTNYDERIGADPAYADSYRRSKKRLLVVRSLTNAPNLTTADVVGFIQEGLFSVLENKYGPPGLTIAVVRITWNALGVR